MKFFERRKAKRYAQESLRHAAHVRNMREDILAEKELERLQLCEKNVLDALQNGNPDACIRAADELHAELHRLMPPKTAPALRENVEILVVAIVVAMAIRTYLIQPFKIPTGSMQPTLYGITITTPYTPTWMDRMPMKFIKWAFTGSWYREVRVEIGGHLGMPMQGDGPLGPQTIFVTVAGRQYRIPRDGWGNRNFSPNQYVPNGAVLWSGLETAGDHVFVDKMRWNFFSPKRGQIMVFKTLGIQSLPQDTHYIKRLVGLPGETISIDTPDLLINGQTRLHPEDVRHNMPNVDGYTLSFLSEGVHLAKGRQVALTDKQYLGLGDNSANSRDGRHWGAVPSENLVGPACFVYWPFSSRWGRIRN